MAPFGEFSDFVVEPLNGYDSPVVPVGYHSSTGFVCFCLNKTDSSLKIQLCQIYSKTPNFKIFYGKNPHLSNFLQCKPQIFFKIQMWKFTSINFSTILPSLFFRYVRRVFGLQAPHRGAPPPLPVGRSLAQSLQRAYISWSNFITNAHTGHAELEISQGQMENVSWPYFHFL